MHNWLCNCCGEKHEELPLHYGAEAPALYYRIPANEVAVRCEINRDLCVIDEKYFFIVGNLEIPIIGSDEFFSWDVWVSLSASNFIRACELWENSEREKEPPYFGWLSTSLPGYPETLSLKTNVHTRDPGVRPFIELEPTDHQLAIEQRTGISWERVQEIAEIVLHNQQ
jgi:hypothetical protein